MRASGNNLATESRGLKDRSGLAMMVLLGSRNDAGPCLPTDYCMKTKTFIIYGRTALGGHSVLVANVSL